MTRFPVALLALWLLLLGGGPRAALHAQPAAPRFWAGAEVHYWPPPQGQSPTVNPHAWLYLRWDPRPGAQGYELQRRWQPATGPAVELQATLAASTTGATDRVAGAGGAATYRLRLLTTTAPGPWSDPVEIALARETQPAARIRPALGALGYCQRQDCAIRLGWNLPGPDRRGPVTSFRLLVGNRPGRMVRQPEPLRQYLYTDTVQPGTWYFQVQADRGQLPAEISLPVKMVLRTGPGPVAVVPTPTPRPTPSSWEGRLRALAVASPTQHSSYDRDSWGGWADADGDCQNTRQELLLLRSGQRVEFTRATQCTVATGQWTDPWSGATFTQAADVDIDHHVPVFHAHISGGHAWRAAQKALFYNDARNLHIMQDDLNQAKGAAGPEAWQPPQADTWCQYAQEWITTKSRYQLTVSPAEQTALGQMLQSCAAGPGPGG